MAENQEKKVDDKESQSKESKRTIDERKVSQALKRDKDSRAYKGSTISKGFNYAKTLVVITEV